jgi:membrane protein YdbS with pleckstrin-like domain
MPAVETPDTVVRPRPVEAERDTLATLSAETLLPAHLLDGDEIIILAIKPSPWYVLVRSARFLIVTAIFSYVAWWLAWRTAWIETSAVVQVVALVAIARLFVAFLGWVSRLYVLTNRRIMRVRGVRTVDMHACPLIKLRSAEVLAGPVERAVGLGTIVFETTALALDPLATWEYVSRPADVREQVQRAIERAHAGKC